MASIIRSIARCSLQKSKWYLWEKHEAARNMLSEAKRGEGAIAFKVSVFYIGAAWTKLTLLKYVLRCSYIAAWAVTGSAECMW